MAEGQMKVTKLLKDYKGWVKDVAILFLQELKQHRNGISIKVSQNMNMDHLIVIREEVSSCISLKLG